MEKGGLERYTIIVRRTKYNIGGEYIAIMANDACEELAMGIGSSPYRALLMVAHKVGELERIPEEELLTLIADEIHLTIPLGEFLDNLTLEK